MNPLFKVSTTPLITSSWNQPQIDRDSCLNGKSQEYSAESQIGCDERGVVSESMAASAETQIALPCPPQLNHPKLPVLPVIAAALKRIKDQQAEDERSSSFRKKVISKKPKAERRHRSIVVGVE